MAYPAYERFEGTVTADDDDIISSASEDANSLDQGQGQLVLNNDNQGVSSDVLPRDQRAHDLLQNKWPMKIGTIQVITGVITLLLGLTQVLVLPIIDDNSTGYWTPKINKTNFYGISLWSALLMLLTGTLGVRSAIYRSTGTLYAFVTVIMLDVIAFPCFLITILITYSEKWIARDIFPPGSYQFEVSIGASAAVGLCFVLVILAFTQYYDEVFFGELQMCRRILHCCLPCVCPRVVNPDELLEEENRERPPSLPV